ncbi:MAG: hypothetical protein AABN95_20795 [Acidobacteriota bacterium]
MRLLKATLIVKILLTICWSAPLLFFSANQFETWGMPEPKPILFTRLLGAAFVALLVGYALGLRDLHLGTIPFNTILVGIVSNGLACVLLIYFGLQGIWSEWGEVTRYSLWASAILTGLITGLLCISVLSFGKLTKKHGRTRIETPV